MTKARDIRGIGKAAVSIAALILILGSVSLRADEVTLAGSTSGVVVGVPSLTFAGNTFVGTTFLGVGALSGANQLGTFTLAPAAPSLVAGTFTLNITFTAPTGINGGQLAAFNANIQGSVSPVVNQGGVFIDFGTSQTFTFSNGVSTGSFNLNIADLFVQTGQTADVTAGFTGQQTAVPEPGILTLLGFGLVGVVASFRKLRRS
jgi:hypothetical protein